MRILTKHLHDVNESYLVHAKHALYFVINLFYASITLIIHAVFPPLFTTTSSGIVGKLWSIMSVRRKLLDKTKESRVAIIGFGAAGMITLYNLVKNAQKNLIVVDIFDKDFLSFGVAYNTNHMHHLLNVRASNMSAVEGDKQHFVRWLSDNGFHYLEHDFVPRFIYGLYLKDLVRDAKNIASQRGIKINFYHKEVKNIAQISFYFNINNDIYSRCYLCIGTSFANEKQNYWNIPKYDLKQYISDKETIHIVGTGLSSFDAVFEIISFGFNGNFILHSRGGKIPHVHGAPSASSAGNVATDISSWNVKHFISLCRKSQNWRQLFDSIRPFSKQIWQSFSLSQKKSITRHMLRYWNVHRHRLSQEIHEKITALINSDMLKISKDRPPIGSIDCTGFNLHNITELENNLIKNDIVARDDLGMGIVSLKDNLTILGAKNFGTLFETTAIPEIRSQIFQSN